MLKYFKIAKKLNAKGILGMNQRNGNYISLVNKRKYFPLVDDKIKTKELALKYNVSVPELYSIISYEAQVKDIHKLLEQHQEFVVKPSRGSGGEGIIVVSGRMRDKYRKVSGSFMSKDELDHHISMTLGGVYSLGGNPDQVIIEQKVNFDPIFDPISYLGVPDIRIISYLGVPVMSMIRLPTRASDGKANLHQGAVGAGIQISTGKTVAAVIQNSNITQHPDTGGELIDVSIPHWSRLLEIAASSLEMTNLGYVGVDIVLDKTHGPMLLELNARPGLNIQIANKCGLGLRLDVVQKNQAKLKGASIADRVGFAVESF